MSFKKHCPQIVVQFVTYWKLHTIIIRVLNAVNYMYTEIVHPAGLLPPTVLGDLVFLFAYRP